MKRIFNSKTNIFLCVSFTILIVVLSIIISKIGFHIKYDIDKQNFGEKFKEVTIKSNELLSMEEYLDIVTKSNELVYGNPLASKSKREDMEKVMSVFPVLESKPYSYKRKELDGRYFENEELNKGKKVAIIGYNLEEMCKKKDGKLYLDIELQDEILEFEVIGIVREDSFLDTSVFIPYKSIYNTKVSKYKSDTYNFFIPVNSEYISSSKNVYIQEIKNYSETSLLKIISLQIKRMFDTIKNLVICIALAVINCIIFSIFWIRSIKRKISIFKILGADNKYIFKYIFKNTFIIGIIGMLIGGGVVVIIAKVLYLEDSLRFSTIIISTIVTLLISLISSIFSYIDILKFNIKNHIR